MICIHYNNGRVLQGVVLAFGDRLMRVAIKDSDDAVEFRLVNQVWVSEDCEVVKLEFSEWEARVPCQPGRSRGILDSISSRRPASLQRRDVAPPGRLSRTYVQNHGSADRVELRVAKLQPHAASDETGLEHRAAPTGAVNRNRNGLRAKHRMARDQRLVPTLIQDGVRAILGSEPPERFPAEDPADGRRPQFPIGRCCC